MPRTGTILECRQVARGHERRTFLTDHLGKSWLEPLEWVAMEVKVWTDDCVHEHDFLERAIHLCVKAREITRAGRQATRSGLYLKLPFIDASVVHRMYSELPGGYVMLSDGV